MSHRSNINQNYNIKQKEYLQMAKSNRNPHNQNSFKEPSDKIHFNPFRNPKKALGKRLSRQRARKNYNTEKKKNLTPNSRRILTIEDAKLINESLKNDLAFFEKPKIHQVRHTVGNDNRRIDSLTVATKISVSNKLAPQLRFFRGSGRENYRGGTQSFKTKLPKSFIKNLKSNSNLKLLTPKSSMKEFVPFSNPSVKGKVNLADMNLIRWEGDNWPDIEAELSFGKCLGQGSFAKVFQGIDKKLKKHVAIKVVDKAKLDDDKRKKLAQKEINILSSIQHKNLCRFYRLLEDHKRVRFINLKENFFIDFYIFSGKKNKNFLNFFLKKYHLIEK